MTAGLDLPAVPDELDATSIWQFRRMHRWATQLHGQAREQCFCAFATRPAAPDLHGDCPCGDAGVRYQAVNLESLNRLGTIEVRAFPATHDAERAGRWVHFLLRFTDRFKNSQAWRDGVNEDVSASLRAAQAEQLDADLPGLARDLDMDLSFFQARSWLGPTC